MKSIIFAGGCFWGIEKYFSCIDGVVSTEVSYVNGTTDNPSYEDVCYKNTGHAEAISIEYDETKISLEKLLLYFYQIIDPTSLNQQGNDKGTQYRTGIYTNNLQEQQLIKSSLQKLQQNYDKPIVVEIDNIHNYTKAEEYHQKYLQKNPNSYCYIK